VAFEVLILASMVTGAILARNNPRRNNKLDSDAFVIIGLYYNTTVFFVIMSAIITSEYRHDYDQLQRKLGVKRMFVRYVSGHR
jgi:hypothetical protein